MSELREAALSVDASAFGTGSWDSYEFDVEAFREAIIRAVEVVGEDGPDSAALAQTPAADAGLDELRRQVEDLKSYHPHEAPYVGGDASLPCHPEQCAGGMKRRVLALIDARLVALAQTPEAGLRKAARGLLRALHDDEDRPDDDVNALIWMQRVRAALDANR